MLFPENKLLERSPSDFWEDQSVRDALAGNAANGRKKLVVSGLWTGSMQHHLRPLLPQRDRLRDLAGQTFSAGQMMLGGATLPGPRYVWWNFVSSSQEKIEHAKEQWRRGAWGTGQFDLPPDDR